MKEIVDFLHAYPYVTYALSVTLLTAGVRYQFFNNISLGPKWITGIVGLVLGATFFFMRWIDLEKPYEFFVLFAALGASSAFYDYFIKFIIDLAKRKNPFREDKPNDGKVDVLQ